MELKSLIEGLDYELLSGTLSTEVKDITNDSRKVSRGSLFFCIVGAKTDGHDFIDSTVEKQVSVLLVEKDIVCPAGVTVVKCKSTRYAMGVVSSRFYGEPSKKLTVIGITGTKGKTTTTYMIREMLLASGHKTGLIGTIEIIDGKAVIPSANTTPESIVLHKKLKDMVDNGLDSVVMEVSSQGLMLDRVAGVDFDYGIYTNLSPDHIGPAEHKSFEEYRDWKKKLFSLCKEGIFNLDDENAAYMMEGATCKINTFSIHQSADYQAQNHKLYRQDGVLGVEYDLTGRRNGHIMVDMPGDFSISNSLAALAVADKMGVSMEAIQDILKKIKVKGRVEMIPISDQFTLLIDYAHNEMSLRSIIQSLREYQPNRIVTLFGCGGDRSRDRRFKMGEVSGNCADLTIITSDNPRTEEPQAIIDDIKTGIGKTQGKYVEIIDRKEAIQYAIFHGEPGDVIILAGKGHEDYQEINGVKHHMDERELIREILEENDVTGICGYNNRYFA
jgi:UDP-N-acetylmuramoyl-L-alanyl-D-glutamate--2,6-diaminopimelate ligase